MSRGVSNSFDYIAVKRLDGFVLGPQGCTAHVLGLSRSRTSRVVIGKFPRGFVLLRTRTTDFESSEIREIVHGRGQLYLDVSAKPQIDDFASDVVQMPMAGECLACPALEDCCCCYVPRDQSRFLQDETWTRDLLARLSGRVLDVGQASCPMVMPSLPLSRLARWSMWA